MQKMPSGAMLSVPLSEKELIPLISEDICLAAVNNPTRCVVSGTDESIAAFSEQLRKKGHVSRGLTKSLEPRFIGAMVHCWATETSMNTISTGSNGMLPLKNSQEENLGWLPKKS